MNVPLSRSPGQGVVLRNAPGLDRSFGALFVMTTTNPQTG